LIKFRRLHCTPLVSCQIPFVLRFGSLVW
jgi:hypothetical protein